MNLYELTQPTEGNGTKWKRNDREWVYPSSINTSHLHLDLTLHQWETSHRLVSLLRMYTQKEGLRIKPIFNQIVYEITNGRCITKKQFDTTTKFLQREKPYKSLTYTELFINFQWVIKEFLEWGEDLYQQPLFHSDDPKGKEFLETKYRNILGENYVPPKH